MLCNRCSFPRSIIGPQPLRVQLVSSENLIFLSVAEAMGLSFHGRSDRYSADLFTQACFLRACINFAGLTNTYTACRDVVPFRWVLLENVSEFDGGLIGTSCDPVIGFGNLYDSQKATAHLGACLDTSAWCWIQSLLSASVLSKSPYSIHVT